MILCPTCNSKLVTIVSINNMLGELNYKLEKNTIESCVTSLVPNNVNLKAEGFYCISCGKKVAKDSVHIQCSYSGMIDILANFVVCNILSSSNHTVARKVVHKDKVEDFKARGVVSSYLGRDSFTVKTSPLLISDIVIRKD